MDIDLVQELFIPMVVEGYFYGVYSAIFAMYIQYRASKKNIDMTKKILPYALYILYILSTVTFAADMATFVINTKALSNPGEPAYGSYLVDMLHFYWVSTITTGLCDFISQGILIYRCWVVWGGNTRVIIIPSIIALTFLACWLATIDTDIRSVYVLTTNTAIVLEDFDFQVIPVRIDSFVDGDFLKNLIALISIALSLIVNAIATTLIVLRIIRVYWNSKRTLGDENLRVSGGSKLQSVIFVIIESGMALFAIQLFRLCITVLGNPNYRFVIGINQMLNGIAPTIIFVRISMKLSYHDEKSLVETTRSLRFASHTNQDPVSETGSINIVDQGLGKEKIHDLDHDVEQSDDVNIEEI